jgi:hypothetical protein
VVKGERKEPQSGWIKVGIDSYVDSNLISLSRFPVNGNPKTCPIPKDVFFKEHLYMIVQSFAAIGSDQCLFGFSKSNELYAMETS